MSKLTTADVRYRLTFTDGETLTVQVIVADRAAAGVTLIERASVPVRRGAVASARRAIGSPTRLVSAASAS